MDAFIPPLEGKYYGTIIQYGGDRTIKVWNMEGNTPSERQLKQWGMTLEESQESGMICDSHYETVTSYKIARAIQRALDGLDL